MTQGRYLSSHDATTGFVRTIDGHENSAVKTLFYDGELKGQPAKAIAYTWSGQALCADEEFCSVVHAFLAPTAQFEALGGGAVLAVAWLQQDAPDGITSMNKYGSLPAGQATEKLAQYAGTWMASYIQTHVQMMQMTGQNVSMDQQLMESMQSYNNALSECEGWDCSIPRAQMVCGVRLRIDENIPTDAP